MLQKLIKIFIGIFNYNSLKRLLKNKKLKYVEDIYFLHIRKCGGTNLGNSFKKINENSFIKIIKLRHKDKIYNLDINQKYCFSVREPINAYISAFNDRKRDGRPTFNIKKNLFEKISFYFFKNSDELAKNLYSKNIFKKILSNFAIRSITHVNEPLYSWFKISEIKRHKPFFIFDVRSLDDDCRLFCKKLKIQNVPLSSNMRISHKSPFMKDDLTKTSKKNLKKYFSKDIEIYNYIHSIKDTINLS
tara:strand:- start:543 stop:1280 length:738 start_codon:yes stop_codon:yes gene_type:complete